MVRWFASAQPRFGFRDFPENLELVFESIIVRHLMHTIQTVDKVLVGNEGGAPAAPMFTVLFDEATEFLHVLVREIDALGVPRIPQHIHSGAKFRMLVKLLTAVLYRLPSQIRFNST